MRDSLARGLWIKGKLDEIDIPGDEWKPQATAEYVGELLLHYPCEAPEELAGKYGQSLVDVSTADDKAVVEALLDEFYKALEAYIKKHRGQGDA